MRSARPGSSPSSTAAWSTCAVADSSRPRSATRRLPGRRAIAARASVTASLRPTSSCAHRAHDHGAAPQAAGEEAEQLERCVVGPLEVVEQDDHGLVAAGVLEQLGERVEPLELGGLRLARLHRHLAGEQLGEGRRDLDAVIGELAQRGEPRPQGRCGTALVAPAPDRDRTGSAVGRDPSAQLLGETGLADAGLALDDDELRVAAGIGEGVEQGGQLGRARPLRSVGATAGRSGPWRLGLGPGGGAAVVGTGGAAGRSRARSWSRIADSRSRRARPGSMPSSSRSVVAASARLRSASAWRPER